MGAVDRTEVIGVSASERKRALLWPIHHHDVGHAIAGLAVAAAGLGWEARLLEGVTDTDLARLLGVDGQRGIEAEHPDCLLAIYPQGLPQGVPLDQLQDAVFPMDQQRTFTISDVVRAPLRPTEWLGVHFWKSSPASNSSLSLGDTSLALRTIVQQRRSAVAFDGRTGITREVFPSVTTT